MHERIKTRCCYAEQAKKNEIDEELVWCIRTGQWMNATLGECYGNCESEG